MRPGGSTNTNRLGPAGPRPGKREWVALRVTIEVSVGVVSPDLMLNKSLGCSAHTDVQTTFTGPYKRPLYVRHSRKRWEEHKFQASLDNLVRPRLKKKEGEPET